MNRNKQQPEKFTRILSLLVSILLLSFAVHTEPGEAFLEYAKEMTEDMPFVSKITELGCEIQEKVENVFPDFRNRISAGRGDDAESEETTQEKPALFPESEGNMEQAPVTDKAEDNEQIRLPESETIFPLNHSAYFPQSVKFKGNRLTLCAIPEEETYRYIMLQLYASDGAIIYQETDHRSKSGEVSFSLRTVKAATGSASNVFTMRMYSNSKQYGNYRNFLELSIEKTDSGWRFAQSPAYERNDLFAQDERSDVNALTYYLRSSERIQSDDAFIRELSNQITADVADMYERVLLIHDWVSNNIYYDNDVFYKRTESGDSSAVGTLRSRLGVCEGYANLTCALLRAAGIPAKTVSGYALGIDSGSEFPADVLDGTGRTNHAWNEACVNGRWISLDTTWDSGNKYEYGKITENAGCSSRRYFDISRELLALDHAVMDSNNYREIFLYYNDSRMETADGWKMFSESDLSPYEKDGHMMAPVGAIIEEMGGTCEWDRIPGYYDRLRCYVNGHYLQLWPTQPELCVDDFIGKEAERLTFDVPPEVVNGYTMVQVDLTFSSIECDVDWDENQQRLAIGYVT